MAEIPPSKTIKKFLQEKLGKEGGRYKFETQYELAAFIQDIKKTYDDFDQFFHALLALDFSYDLFFKNFAHYLEFLIIKEYTDKAVDNNYLNVNNTIEDACYL